MIYIVDTDAIAHIQDRPDSARIYANLLGCVDRGELRTVEQVFGELKKWPDVRTMFWAKRTALRVDQYHPDVMAMVGYISDNHEYLFDLSGSKNPDPADPWLIACAKVFGYTLVTDERQRSIRKIPHVCRQQGIDVRCINGIDMIGELGCG